MRVTSVNTGPKGRKDAAQYSDCNDAALASEPACIPRPEVVKDGNGLPNGWAWVAFKDATVNFDGRRVPVKEADRAKRSGPYPYYGASGVIDDIDDYLFEGYFLLVAEDGANLLSRSTPIAFRASGKFWVNNHAHVVKSRDGVSQGYLEHFLNSIDLKFYVTGSAQPKLTQANLNKILIPLPPTCEQHRIVAEIEKQFTRLEVGVAALRRVQANLKRYRAAVLKAACEGRLVPTEADLSRSQLSTKNSQPSYETGEQLLQRILSERRKSWAGRGKFKEPIAPDTASLPPLPEGWVWGTPDQLSSPDPYSLAIGPFGSNLKVSDYTGSGVPLVFVRNIRSSSFGGEGSVFVSKRKAEELRAHQVAGGDVLITKMGEPPGDACLYPDSEPGAIITADCVKLRLSPVLSERRFFVHAINSEVVKPQILRITKGVAQMKVSLGRFSTLAIPLPPLAEQKRIVAEVEHRLSVVEELEAVVNANLQRAARLRQSILQRAFMGELVTTV